MSGTGPSVAIVGAGFGGIGTAVSLRREGIEDVVVLERGDRVGGVWSHNTYPGAACDVPSHLYSYSFARNPWWGAASRSSRRSSATSRAWPATTACSTGSA